MLKTLTAPSKELRIAIGASLGVAVLMVMVLRSMGRVWWCECGRWNVWTSDVISSHNSQHLLDPYGFSHFQHGLAFYLGLWLLLRKRFDVPARAALALGLEAVWEIVENTPFTIERYRAATISLDYYGDTVLNSVGDLVCCALGFAFAASVPAWSAVTIYFGIEAAMLWLIRDSLFLNIIMLLSPSDAIRRWQSGG